MNILNFLKRAWLKILIDYFYSYAIKTKDWEFPKIYECDPIELEFIGKKNVIIPFKYINISNVHHTEDSLYLKLARASS